MEEVAGETGWFARGQQSHARAFKRLLISGAILSDVDGQGRLLVPESLGRYAGIRKAK
jgi:DNA-binding transcriptional regulator/RsmH inhibitor MraZ